MTIVKGEIAEILAQTPSSVLQFESAVSGLPSGRFIRESFSENTRSHIASFFGGPFYALTKLTPELFEHPSINLVFGGALSMMPDEGGRWLSLFRRALPYPGKISCSLCSTAKPRLGRAPRQLLAQPPQSAVAKTWSRHLRETSVAPDGLVLYPPSSFGEYKAFIEELAAARYAGKTLIACRARTEVLILQRMLQAYGLVAGEPVGFAYEDVDVRALTTGAWWLLVAGSDGDHHAPDERDVERLRSVHRVFRDAMDDATNYDHETAIATAFGRRAPVQIGGEFVPDAVLASDTLGIDLGTGRWFRRSSSEEIEGAAGYVFDGVTLTPAITGLIPQGKASESASDSEFRLLTWLARACEYDEGDMGEPSAPQSQGDVVPDEQARDASAAEPASAIGGRHAPAAVRLAETVLTPNALGSPASTLRQRLPHSRLSRSAGTVNVLAIAARLGIGGGDANSSYEATRALILRWLSRKGFGAVPADANYHVETSDGEVTVETDGKQIWALRFDDRKQIEGGAFWRVELALIQANWPAIGLRLYQVRRSEEAPEPVSGVPKVLAMIANEVGLSDYGIPLLSKATRLKGRAGFDLLLDTLLNEDRVQPLIAVSDSQGVLSDLSLDRLAERLVGAAHVVLIDNFISDALIRQFGRERSVFGNAIRLYRPGFNADADPFQHRVWAYSGTQITLYQANDISEEVCAISLEVGDLEIRAPSFISIRSQIGQARLKELRRQAEKVAVTAEDERARQLEIQKSLEVDIAQLREWVRELEARNGQVELENRTLVGERNEALEQVRRLRHRLNLQLEPEYGPYEGHTDDTPWYPDSWELLEVWVESIADGKLILLPSAVKAAQESTFHIELSYKALELLAKHYVPMRQRSADDAEPWRRFNQALAELGLECSPTGDATEQHRYKRDYQRRHEGNTISLDMHLKRGAGFSPEVVFRMYFHYDESEGKVLVGHFPTHLTNSKTH